MVWFDSIVTNEEKLKNTQAEKYRHAFRKHNNGWLERMVDTKQSLKEENKGKYTPTSFDSELVAIKWNKVECKFSKIYIDVACTF